MPDCDSVNQAHCPSTLLWRVFYIETGMVSVPSAPVLRKRSKPPTDPTGESIVRCPIR